MKIRKTKSTNRLFNSNWILQDLDEEPILNSNKNNKKSLADLLNKRKSQIEICNFDRIKKRNQRNLSLYDKKLSQTEKLVNEWINAGLDVTVETMKKEDAVKSGAECMFIEKYPDEVTVYSIGNDDYGTVSKELCGGPHVKNTKELGKFIIKKE